MNCIVKLDVITSSSSSLPESTVSAKNDSANRNNSILTKQKLNGCVSNRTLLNGIFKRSSNMYQLRRSFRRSSSTKRKNTLRKQSKWFKAQLEVYCALHRPVGIYKYYHFILVLFIIIPFVFFNIFEESIFKNESTARLITKIFCIILSPILFIELLLRFWSSSCISKFQGFIGKWKYLKSHFLSRFLDILAVITFICRIIFSTEYRTAANMTFRVFLFFQVMQVSRFKIRALKLASRAIRAQWNQLFISFSIAALALIFASFLIFLFEKGHNDEIVNVFDGFYWGFITLSTVGYGDVTPLTTAGRTFACICTIIGVSTFALPSAVLGTGLAIQVQESKKNSAIKGPAACLIQSFWRCYASSEESNSLAIWKLYKKSDGSCLTESDRQCIRYIGLVKYRIAKRNFKMMTKHMNTNDMFELYRTTHEGISKRIQHIETKVNNLAITVGTKHTYNLHKELSHIKRALDQIINHLNINVQYDNSETSSPSTMSTKTFESRIFSGDSFDSSIRQRSEEEIDINAYERDLHLIIERK